jgi:hypothetical protein
MIQGSSSKIVRIKNILVSGVNASNTTAIVELVRRSTATTGGGATALPLNRRDLDDDTPTAVIMYFTGAATPGSAVGTSVEGYRLILPSSPINTALINFQPGWQNDKSYVLRGASDFFCLSTTGVPSGSTLDITIGLVEDTEPA